VKTINEKKEMMKKAIIALAYAFVAPVAFAQTSTSTTETTTEPATTTQTMSTTYTAGTVTTYEPGRTVVVKGEQGPVNFAVGTAARIVDGAGKIVTAPLRAGQKVRVYYTGPETERVVERVVVEDQD
jgi:ABC-type transport system substrate-binding protein